MSKTMKKHGINRSMRSVESIVSPECDDNIMSSWDDAVPWEKAASARVARYTEAGLVVSEKVFPKKSLRVEQVFLKRTFQKWKMAKDL